MLEKPIIIMGAPRSGTSILTKLLSAHPDLAIAMEPRLIWRHGNDQRSDLLSREHATPQVVKVIRERFDQIVTNAGKSRLLEKTPSNALRPEFIHEVFPDAVFIQILRDPVDCIMSIRKYWEGSSGGMKGVNKKRVAQRLKEMRPSQAHRYAKEIVVRILATWGLTPMGRPLWGPRLPGLDEMARDMALVEVAAMQWRMCVEQSCSYLRSLPEQKYLELQLESFDLKSLHRVLDFAGLAVSSEVDERFAEIFSPDKQDRKQLQDQYDPEEIRRIRRLIDPTVSYYALKERGQDL